MSDPVPPSSSESAGGAPLPPRDSVSIIHIEEEMKRSYLDYAMSVIVSRALPDVRDGLKPVHRRILHAMNEAGYDWSKAYRKSARIVGDVIGKYHPHGDQSVYDALVRLAQDFSMRLPLLDGQGNFGSLDGDPPAAMRYTEIRLAKPAGAMLEDIDKDTVDFGPNYDSSESEPKVLPARFPNLLVNGAGGIAVGMATNIPPHNLGEVIDACVMLVDRPELTIEEILEVMPGPDFPTGGQIIGRGGIRQAFATGRGSILMRGRVSIEERSGGRETIVITEVPYQVNKASMVEKIAELVREKKVEGISDLRDESDRDGVRVVVELKKEAMADIVLNQLYRYSQLQTSFGVNLLALNGGRPLLMNVKDVLSAFINFREEVITRRTRFDLAKARDRAHVLVGLAIAVANIDEVIALIRNAPDPGTAKAQLLARDWPAEDVAPLIVLIADPRHVVREGTYRMSEEQAKAILDLRLQRLTGLGREEIQGELEGLGLKISDYLDILRNRPRLMSILKEEMLAVKAAHATPRRTDIVDGDSDVDDEDLIQREDMVVTVTNSGWIKRVPLSTYRTQLRGGKGRTGMATKDEDFVSTVFVADTHTPVLFFSTTGMVYKLKVWRLPLGTPTARGKAMVNLLPLGDGETITTVMPLPDQSKWPDLQIMFATRSGDVRRNELTDVANVKANGKIAMKPEEGDGIVGVGIVTNSDDVLLATKLGKCIRFVVDDVRVFMSRASTGVRGIRLGDGDEVISLSVLRHVEATPAEARAYLKLAAMARRAADAEDAAGEETPIPAGLEDDEEDVAGEVALSPERYAELAAQEQFILTITERGYGKRTSAFDYRITRRGGQGIFAIAMSERNGPVVGAFPVEDHDELVVASDGGQIMRCPVNDIRIAGRNTQGVVVFRAAEDERVVSVAHLSDTGPAEDAGEEGPPDEGPAEDAGGN